MSMLNSMAAISTKNVLTDSVVAKMKHFTFEGHTFSPIYLAGLAEEIKYDYLRVEFGKSPSYCARTNTIFLNFLVPTKASQKAMIVHEATHAMFDFQGREMDIAASESLSYIAQCMYARLTGAFDLSDPDDRLSSWKWNEAGEAEYTVNDGVFAAGWEIAADLLAPGGGAITAAHVKKMRAAVAAHTFYSKNHTQKTDFDGYL